MPTFCAEDIVGERTMSAARHKDRPACGCTADVEEIQTGGHGDVVPGPRTSLLVKTGGQTLHMEGQFVRIRLPFACWVSSWFWS